MFKPKIISLEEYSDEAEAGEETSTVMEGDETAYGRNMNELSNELRKSVHQIVVIQSLLELTFVKRREDITTCSSHTLEIRDKYQFLKQKKWVTLSSYSFI